MAEGKINRLFPERGFGFIKPEKEGKDVFFHARQVRGDLNFDRLREGMKVYYEAKIEARGPQATEVIASEEPGSRPAPAAVESLRATMPDYRFLNPYNFVRFLTPPAAVVNLQETPPTGSLAAQLASLQIGSHCPKPVDKTVQQLLGRCPPPPHDRYLGLNGRVRCTLEAVTPLFVSDSEEIHERGGHKNCRFFRLGDKKALPAASLRGMVRSVFEAATNACMIHFAGGTRLSRHANTGEALILVPAVVEETPSSSGELAIRLLNGNTPLSPGKRPQGPQYAAWVPRYLHKMLRNSSNTPANTPYGSRNNIEEQVIQNYEKGFCWALLERVRHPQRGFEFYSVKEFADTPEGLGTADSSRGEIIGEGYLHITNQNIENKHDERFFFVKGGLCNADRVLPLCKEKKESKDVIRRYRELIEDYQARHRDEADKCKKSGRDPSLPYISDNDWRTYKPALSSFILDESASRLKPGDLVYASLDTDLKVKFLAPVSIPRVAYDNTLGERLPFVYEADDERAIQPGNLAPCDHIDRLCPACRTFGWVSHPENKDESRGDDHHGAEGGQKTPTAYAGRLRFSHGELEHEAGTLDPICLAILSSPKPTTTRFYLEPWTHDGKRDMYDRKDWKEAGAMRGYDGDANFLRGRKFYRHHERVQPEEYRRAGTRADDQNRTVIDALKPGARFSFTIDFHNLAALELGALLWSLEMDGKAFHRLGYAKPLGFGSVKLDIEQLELMDPGIRYASLDKHAGWSNAMEKKKEFVDAFKQQMANTYPEGSDGFGHLPNIEDLLCLLGEHQDQLPIHYPRSGEQADQEGKNFEWFIGNNRKTQLILQLPTEDEGLPRVRRDGRLIN